MQNVICLTVSRKGKPFVTLAVIIIFFGMNEICTLFRQPLTDKYCGTFQGKEVTFLNQIKPRKLSTFYNVCVIGHQNSKSKVSRPIVWLLCGMECIATETLFAATVSNKSSKYNPRVLLLSFQIYLL
jgi:hypothetical protein